MRRSDSARLPRIACAIAFLALTHAQETRAAIRTWNNAGGGLAGVAANWTPAGVPATSDLLSFSIGGAYSVTFGAAVPVSQAHLFSRGELLLRFPTPHSVWHVFSVAPTAGDLSTARITSGTLTTTGELRVGDPAGALGVLEITGGATSLVASGAAGLNAVGRLGTGTLAVLEGATATFANGIEVGELVGGSGAIRVEGESVSPARRSTLRVSTIGLDAGSAGTSDIRVLDGGLLDVYPSLDMAGAPNSNATLLVSGQGATDSARVSIGNTLNIGRNSANALPGGTATFTVGNYGVATVDGSTYTFDDVPGGSGKLVIREHGRFSTGNLWMRDPSIELENRGLLQVKQGTLDLGGHALAVDDSTRHPIVELHSQALCHVYSATAPAATIGGVGGGTLRVLGGSFVGVHDANAILGDGAAGDGRVEVSGAGSWFDVDEALLVGRTGRGVLALDGGSTADLHQLAVATQATGDGAIDAAGTGTEVRVSDSFDLAGLPAGASNAPGVVNLSLGARLRLNRPVFAGTIWPTGDLNIRSGSALHLVGGLTDLGDINLESGSILGGAIQPASNGRVTGAGDINSQVLALADTTGTITATGSLLLGSSTAPLGFQFAGRLDVNSRTVTLRDADSAVVGTVTLNGGRLTGPTGGIHLPLDRRITGSGAIQAAIRPVGRVIATGSAGIQFEGPVLGAGQGMSGTLLRFRTGSSFVGGGMIAGGVLADSGSVLAPTKFLVLGQPSLGTTPIELNGTLLVPRTVTVDLFPVDTTRVGGTIQLLGGALIGGGKLLIRPGGTLRGTGACFVPARIAGVLDPGVGMRKLALGETHFEGTARFTFDVGAFAAGALDTVTMASTATLGGTLEIVTQPGFAPVAGDSFLVLSATTISGAFSTVTLNGAPAAGSIALRTHGGQLWALVQVNALDAPQGGSGASLTALRFGATHTPSRRPAFALDLPVAASARIELFDIGGRRIATLYDGPLALGRHAFAIPTGLAPGLCLARAELRDGPLHEVRVAKAVRLP